MTIPRPISMIVMNEEDNNGQQTVRQEEKTPMEDYQCNGGNGTGSSSSDQQNLDSIIIPHTESELSSSGEFIVNDNIVPSRSQIDADDDNNNTINDDDLQSSDRDMDQHEQRCVA